jgi:adenylate kinase
MATYIILMGMQGAGKGTQAQELAKATGIPHITSGGMFRTTMQSDTPLAKQIQSYYDQGKLVPDTLTIAMIKDRFQQPDVATKGVILDGFPRTLAQAEALDTMLAELGEHVAAVPFFVISEAAALERLQGRMVCSKDENHNGGYHIINKPPKVPGICDVCGSPLKVRKDDTPDGIRQRIEAYKRDTTPVLDYYRERGLLTEINAEQPIETVFADLQAVVLPQIDRSDRKAP